MKRVVVFGAYGTFGALVAKQLAERGVAVVACGRDLERARALADSLPGGGHSAVAADAGDFASARAALDGAAVAACCAGPFSTLGAALLDACLDAGCHYADIADDRAHAERVRASGERFAARGLVAAYGCSSLPGISGALALAALEGAPSPPERARVTLLIGNRNPKGAAAVASLVGSLGRPFRAPHRTLHGFGEREVVALPAPFGRRAAYSFQSPEYDLFPSLLGARAVEVKVAFELRAATAAIAALGKISSRWGAGTAAALGAVGKTFGGFGRSGGAVQCDLFFAGGAARTATAWSERDAQPMAALPCSLAAAKLVSSTEKRGAMTAYELLGARELLDELAKAGYRVSIG